MLFSINVPVSDAQLAGMRQTKWGFNFDIVRLDRDDDEDGAAAVGRACCTRNCDVGPRLQTDAADATGKEGKVTPLPLTAIQQFGGHTRSRSVGQTNQESGVDFKRGDGNMACN